MSAPCFMRARQKGDRRGDLLNGRGAMEGNARQHLRHVVLVGSLRGARGRGGNEPTGSDGIDPDALLGPFDCDGVRPRASQYSSRIAASSSNTSSTRKPPRRKWGRGRIRKAIRRGAPERRSARTTRSLPVRRIEDMDQLSSTWAMAASLARSQNSRSVVRPMAPASSSAPNAALILGRLAPRRWASSLCEY